MQILYIAEQITFSNIVIAIQFMNEIFFDIYKYYFYSFIQHIVNIFSMPNNYARRVYHLAIYASTFPQATLLDISSHLFHEHISQATLLDVPSEFHEDITGDIDCRDFTVDFVRDFVEARISRSTCIETLFWSRLYSQLTIHLSLVQHSHHNLSNYRSSSVIKGLGCILDPIWNIDLRNWHFSLCKFEST